MFSSFSIEVLMGLLAVGAIAQESPVKLCNSEDCDYCPSSITTTGTGYPSCVIYVSLHYNKLNKSLTSRSGS